jgi:hypothetical protein
MAPFSIHQAIKLLKTGHHADLKSVCSDRNFRVQRAIICSQSDFFEACDNSGFKEQTEAKIELMETDPDILAVALVFLYTSSIDPNVTEQV